MGRVTDFFGRVTDQFDPSSSEKIGGGVTDAEQAKRDQAKKLADFNAAAPGRATQALNEQDAEARKKLLLMGRGVASSLGTPSFAGDTSRANTVSSTLGVG